ncbi:MAG TPA: MurT ligase domain-containing protein [Nitrolancea sp.]|nr:MurT ligase domain-containing protein [Nitrolancea sp.]
MSRAARPAGLDLRLATAVVASKLSGAAIRRLGRGGGTSAPGVVANLIDPNVLDKLSRRVEGGCVVVAGTNGKTTTARMLADILEAAGLRVIHNRSGSNLVRGISAAFTGQSTLRGRPRGRVAVVEADEAAFPEVVRRTRPRLVLLLNLFRDQLDRYGELDTIARRWREALLALAPEQTVLINADDPALAALSEGIEARRLTFGLADSRYLLAALPHAADAALCRRCGAPLRYERLFLSHLGDYACERCGFHRPALDYAARDIALHALDSVALQVETPDGDLPLTVAVPGLYNGYNALAAAAAARTLGVEPATVQAALARFQSAFGRIERVSYQGRTLVIVLIKNPVGFNEVLRMLALSGLADPALIVINDLDADGRDVSWLWDADVEQLATVPAPLYTSGIRGGDMAVRLKYAGVPQERIHPLGPLRAALGQFVEAVPVGGTAYVLPTYTALLEVRGILTERGAVGAFWEE